MASRGRAGAVVRVRRAAEAEGEVVAAFAAAVVVVAVHVHPPAELLGRVRVALCWLGVDLEPRSQIGLLQTRGAEGKRLQAAVELCETEDIGTVDELREVHDSGRFGALGFKPVSAGRIEQALAAVAPYERRRAQDGASATCNPDIARLEARLDAVTAIQYVNMCPVPPTRNPPHAPKPPTSILLYGVWLPPLERPFSLSL